MPAAINKVGLGWMEREMADTAKSETRENAKDLSVTGAGNYKADGYDADVEDAYGAGTPYIQTLRVEAEGRQIVGTTQPDGSMAYTLSDNPGGIPVSSNKLSPTDKAAVDKAMTDFRAAHPDVPLPTNAAQPKASQDAAPAGQSDDHKGEVAADDNVKIARTRGEVLFKKGSSTIATEEQKAALAAYAEEFVAMHKPEIEAAAKDGKALVVLGYHSEEGNPKLNAKLSLARAQKVAAMVKEQIGKQFPNLSHVNITVGDGGTGGKDVALARSARVSLGAAVTPEDSQMLFQMKDADRKTALTKAGVQKPDDTIYSVPAADAPAVPTAASGRPASGARGALTTPVVTPQPSTEAAASEKPSPLPIFTRVSGAPQFATF